MAASRGVIVDPLAGPGSNADSHLPHQDILSGIVGKIDLMEPVYDADGVTLFFGDCRDVMAQMEPESVSCVVTSPPFYGLRQYDCQSSIWGVTDPNCAHGAEIPNPPKPAGGGPHGDKSGLDGGEYGRDTWVTSAEHVESYVGYEASAKKQINEYSRNAKEIDIASYTCSDCGAWRGQLGQEPRPDCLGWATGDRCGQCYVCHIMEVFRSLRRILRKDGVVWFDIDDSRAGSWGDYVAPVNKGVKPNSGNRMKRAAYEDEGFHSKPPTATSGIPKKNLMLIPQRIALAAQAEGWIVRSEIAIYSWMPESTADRPTDTLRKVWMFTKSPRYWSDFYLLRVPLTDSSVKRFQHTVVTNEQYDAVKHKGGPGGEVQSVVEVLSRTAATALAEGTRNIGNCWLDIPPPAYPDSHFAVYSLAEPERCILATCPAEICTACGVARQRVRKPRETAPLVQQASIDAPPEQQRLGGHRDALRAEGKDKQNPHADLTTCKCGAPFEPGRAFDPFMGTGTTAIAARKLGRRCVGSDASEKYLEQAVKRLKRGDTAIRRDVKTRKQLGEGTEQPTLW